MARREASEPTLLDIAARLVAVEKKVLSLERKLRNAKEREDTLRNQVSRLEGGDSWRYSRFEEDIEKRLSEVLRRQQEARFAQTIRFQELRSEIEERLDRG